MKLKEFLKQVKDMDPESELIMPMHNGEIGTYAVVDKIYNVEYDVISSDFFGTPGPMDKRLFSPDIDKHNIIYISTSFPVKHTI